MYATLLGYPVYCLCNAYASESVLKCNAVKGKYKNTNFSSFDFPITAAKGETA